MDILELINWGEVITNITSSLAVALITSIVGICFVKGYLSQLNFSNRMKELGFVNTSTNKQSRVEIARMCRESKEIKIINVSGFHYLNANEDMLKKALKQGVRIKFLCSNPNSIFLRDIENMEYHQVDDAGKRMRERDNKIAAEIYNLIEKYQKVGLEIRFFSTEYRLPYVLAYYKDGRVQAWLTMTLPPYKSTKAFVLRGERGKDQIYDKETNFVDMMETNFDMIWEHGSRSLDEIMKNYNKKLKRNN